MAEQKRTAATAYVHSDRQRVGARVQDLSVSPKRASALQEAR
jgi:hypothetical protein